MVVRCILIILTLCWPVLAAASKPVRLVEHISLPVSETAFNVRKWLQDARISVEQNAAPGNMIIIRGQGAEDVSAWRIELSSHSALGTEISIEISGEDATDEEAARLIGSLQATAAGTMGDDQAESSVQSIPTPVLDQIGNVACIHVETGGRTVQFTGFFIDNDGLLLCTAHDLREHERVGVMSNTGVFFEGDIIKVDFIRDLALIKVDADKEESVLISDGRNLLGMGEMVYSIGCPINLRGTVESGFINGPPRKVDGLPLWQVHMKIQPGSSGSPLFDSTGAFVAVVKGRHREAEGIGFLIPLEVVIDFLKEYFSP